jgi:hypothetical protein
MSDVEVEAPAAVSVAAHPRARASIRRVRGWSAFAAFGLVLWLSLGSHVPAQEAVVRAIAAGLVANLAAWACAVAVWRQLVVAELRVAEEARRGRRRARAEAEAS